MILPSVSETLAPVSGDSLLASIISKLHSGSVNPADRRVKQRLAGLTDTAKALVASQVAAELRRPVVVVVPSDARAEELVGALQFFYAALTRRDASEVVLLPALDVFPWQEASPHPDILETRGVSLWRYASGTARVVVAPIASALMRLADTSVYAAQACTIARGEDVALDEFVTQLRRLGYESHEMVETPGQFTVRGGIVDVFPMEAGRPVRVELFGDTIESLREFDPNTQRSVNPVERVTLPPLVELPSDGRRAGESAFEQEDPNGSSSLHPKAAALARPRLLFNLHEDTVVILEEPAAIAEAAQEPWRKAGERLGSPDEAVAPETLSAYYLTDNLQTELSNHPTLELERLAISSAGNDGAEE